MNATASPASARCSTSTSPTVVLPAPTVPFSHTARSNTGASSSTPDIPARSRRHGMAYKQSDTSAVLAPWCEELKCDVVGISKLQWRAGSRVPDAAVADAEVAKTDLPCFE